jgi:hypothetical protein
LLFRPRRDATLADLVLKQLPQNSKAASAPTPDGFAFIPLKPCCAIPVDTLHGQAAVALVANEVEHGEPVASTNSIAD